MSQHSKNLYTTTTVLKIRANHMAHKSFLLIDEEIRRLQREKFIFNITNIIIQKPTFVGVTLYGERRIGKSVCGLLSMYEIYKDWDVVFKHVFFSIRDLTTFLMKCAKTDYKCPVIMWDDAGVSGGAQMYHTNRALVHYMGAVFDVIGTALKGIILTTPDSENLLKTLRRANFYKIKVTPGRSKYDRKATIYLPMRTPYEQFRLRTIAVDHFDVRLPEAVYERYYIMRKSYSVSALTDLETFMSGNNGEHIDYDPEAEDSRKEYDKQYHRDRRKGKPRIRKKDWIKENPGYA